MVPDMIFMHAKLEGDVWVVICYVKDHGSFRHVDPVRKVAWRNAWKQIAGIFQVIPPVGNC